MAGYLFFIPAFAGGIFGLLGGYLTDRWGRRRVLTGSILLYACSAFAAGYSTNIYMLLFFRCTTFIGVCVEFVAAVAWLAELFPDPQQRESVLGYTQAFSSVGGLLVAVANGIAVAWSIGQPAPLLFGCTAGGQPAGDPLPEWLGFLGAIKDPHAAWRYTLMSGLIPAIPLIVIRPFLPESPAWQARSDAGTLKRPSLAELFSPQLRRTTIVTTIMFACSYGTPSGPSSRSRRSCRAGRRRSKVAGAAGQERQTSPGWQKTSRSSKRWPIEQKVPGHQDPGDRRAGGTLAAGRAGGPDRQPPDAAAAVPDSRPDRHAVRVRLAGRARDLAVR